ncbi:MAG: hypothetical protein [Caudoviricetes sp.]|nr:MAG: hypothetical protein [Caudoviricetes sp.]
MVSGLIYLPLEMVLSPSSRGGAVKGSFTLNQSGNSNIELTDTNTTYSIATQTLNGLMSATDKAKFDKIPKIITITLKINHIYNGWYYKFYATNITGLSNIIFAEEPIAFCQVGKFNSENNFTLFDHVRSAHADYFETVKVNYNKTGNNYKIDYFEYYLYYPGSSAELEVTSNKMLSILLMENPANYSKTCTGASKVN